MVSFERLSSISANILDVTCSPLSKSIYPEQRNRRVLKGCLGFLGGCVLAQLYYAYLLRKIPFPYYIGVVISVMLSLLLGIGNAISVQIRCISLLTIPMYCGKPGRGVLKAVVLTYVIAGPITNLGLNAKEVVRVFSCSTQLSYNLSKAKYALLSKPFKKALSEVSSEFDDIKETLRSFSEVAAPIEAEINGVNELIVSHYKSDYVDKLFNDTFRSEDIEKKYKPKLEDKEEDIYLKKYFKKLEYRCENQLSQGMLTCIDTFATAYNDCYQALPGFAARTLCWPLKLTYICKLNIVGGLSVCDSRRQADPGLGEGYVYLEKAKKELTDNLKNIKLQYKITRVQELLKIQTAKETGERVMHAFEEKNIIMRSAINVVNVCVALLFLRIVHAAITYHDLYLTSIGYDNVYITSYFKKLDQRRKMKKKYTLLPLKKMERSKYVDIHCFGFLPTERNKFLTQVLKLMLEVITATTFVMLDRLFYEALDVVRQYAQIEVVPEGAHAMDVEVKGSGVLATIIRKVLSDMGTESSAQSRINNQACLPHPRLMPPIYFLKIYGGYLWILILLYFSPYTIRLKRLISSYFYPRREKQRILHLYNDILKKRMKMEKTLRKKAVQAVRAHYLSGENLLSLRMKFPQLLGWLSVLPAARMKCLICGETQPRNTYGGSAWYTCSVSKCPIVCCPECWTEVGEKCLACDRSLSELSDVDSLTEDELPKY